MPNEETWINERISAAKSDHPLVTETVAAMMDSLLNGQVGERQMRQSELAAIAKALITGMVPITASATEIPDEA
jgi:hypothetical protein